MKNVEIFQEELVDLVNTADTTIPINTDTNKKPADPLTEKKPPKKTERKCS